jgi:hypothetical protein
LPIGGCVLNLLWRKPHFLLQIFHTKSPTASTWNIINGIESLLVKNTIAIKMKENGCVVGVL